MRSNDIRRRVLGEKKTLALFESVAARFDSVVRHLTHFESLAARLDSVGQQLEATSKKSEEAHKQARSDLRKHNIREWLKFAVEVVALVAICSTLYATYLQWKTMETTLAEMSRQTTLSKEQVQGTIGQLTVMERTLDEMRNQTNLTKRQTQGNLAAVIDWDHNLSPTGFSITMRNSGGVTAVEANARITGIRKSLPDQKLIGKSINLSLFAPQIPAGSARTEIHPIAPDDWKAIQETEQTLEIWVNVTFGDGFDRTVKKPKYCRSWLSYVSLNANGTPDRKAEWVDCEQFPRHLDQAMKAKAELKLKKTK